jgi:hypothetical protein
MEQVPLTEDELKRMFAILKDYDEAIGFLHSVTRIVRDQDTSSGILMKRAIETLENRVNSLLFELELRGPGV